MRKAIFLGVIAVVFPICGCRLGVRSDPPASSGPAVAADSANGSDAAADSAGAGHPPVLPIPDLGYNAREGRTLYRHYCLFCHGEEGGGDGFNAYNLDPHPRALADSTFQAGHSDDDLAAAIRMGGGAVGLSTGMPPWGRTLNERKIRNIVEFLRSLRATAASGR